MSTRAGRLCNARASGSRTRGGSVSAASRIGAPRASSIGVTMSSTVFCTARTQK